MLEKTKQNLNIFCIIPAYNEENNIDRVIREVKKYIKNIVVVDDDSADKTIDIAQKHSDIIILKHAINRGQGASLETGNQYALEHNADIVVHFDADGQFLANEIQLLTEIIQKGEADIVFGSRFLDKEKINVPPLKRYILFPIAKLVNKLLIGHTLTDPQIGFRALSRNGLEKISIEQDRMAHASEIIAKTFQNNLRFKEVPVTVIYKEFGQGFGGGVKIIKELILNKII